MWGCRGDFAHLSVRASGEIFLALNGSSNTVQMSTRVFSLYDLKLISDGCTHLSCLERTYTIFVCLKKFR